MTSFAELIPSTQSLLPPPCSQCTWWQMPAEAPGVPLHDDPETTRDSIAEEAAAARREWSDHLAACWGSTGLVLLDGPDTVAALQFAPIETLPRAQVLPAGPPPDGAILLFCLRALLDRPARDPSRLLHHALALLRGRGVATVYAYAHPLGSPDLCGLRNLCGLEFLQRNGFRVVRGSGGIFLTVVDLRGLLPSLRDLGWRLRLPTRDVANPSPAAYGRS